MNDAKYAEIEEARAKGMSWAEIAPSYHTNPRALGKAFSVARLARGGAPLRKDAKRASKPAVPADNGDLLTEVKNSLKAEIERYEAALKALERLAS